MSGGIVRFGSYTFPVYASALSDNFRDIRPQGRPLAGADGAWNEDGSEGGVSGPGTVTVGFTLRSLTRSGMDALREAVGAMASWGVQQLVYQPTDLMKGQRFCWARIQSIPIQQRKDEHTDLHQQMQITFRADDPFWYGGGYMPWVIGDGSQIGVGGLTIGSGAWTLSITGGTNTGSVTQNGNAYAQAMVSVMPTSGNAVTHARVQRLVNSVVVDEVYYAGTIPDGQELFVDGRRQYAQLNGANVFGDDFSYRHRDLFRLAPGMNSIRVISQSGSTGTLRLWFYDTWR